MKDQSLVLVQANSHKQRHFRNLHLLGLLDKFLPSNEKLHKVLLLFVVSVLFAMEPTKQLPTTLASLPHTHSHTHTGCLHEGTVEAEGEKRLLHVSQEVLKEAGDSVDVVHFAEHGNGFAAEKLLLQLLHCAICPRQTVQTSLRKKLII